VERKQSGAELDQRIVSEYAATFLSRRDCYPLQVKGGRYVRVNRPLTDELIFQHLYGLNDTTLGAYALGLDNQAKWICYDADTDEQFASLRLVSSALRQMQQPSYLETSRRGGHLWLFLSPTSGYDTRRFAHRLATETGISKGIEIYPKQDYLLDNGYGSLVRLPLGIHRKTGHRYHFIHPDGSPLAPTIREQIRVLADPQLVTSAFFENVLARAHHRKPETPTAPFKPVEVGRNVPLSQAIKGSITVLEFVSRYVVLNSKGVGLCPFHDDLEYSFSVDEENNYWHCFAGCGGGSIIDFWMQWRGKNGDDPAFTPSLLELRDLLLLHRPQTSRKHR